MGISIPVQVAGDSGQASGSPSIGTTLNVPQGSFLIAALNVSTVANDPFLTVVDSVGNHYTIVQAQDNGSGLTTCAFAFCPATIVDTPAGSTFTATTSGGSAWNLHRAWSCSGVQPFSPLDQVAKINQPVAGTSASLSTGTLASPNEIGFAYTYMLGSGSGGGTITKPAAMTDLFNNGYNDIAYQFSNGSTAAMTDNAAWTNSSEYSAVIATFLAAPTVGLIGIASSEW